MFDTDWSLLKETVNVPFPVLMVIIRKIRKQADGQGLGRHSEQEVMAIGQADLKALSVFLGENRQIASGHSQIVTLFKMLLLLEWK